MLSWNLSWLLLLSLFIDFTRQIPRGYFILEIRKWKCRLEPIEIRSSVVRTRLKHKCRLKTSFNTCRGISDGPIDSLTLDQLSADLAAGMPSSYDSHDGKSPSLGT